MLQLTYGDPEDEAVTQTVGASSSKPKNLENKSHYEPACDHEKHNQEVGKNYKRCAIENIRLVHSHIRIFSDSIDWVAEIDMYIKDPRSA